jgi:hypothetical protein
MTWTGIVQFTALLMASLIAILHQLLSLLVQCLEQVLRVRFGMLHVGQVQVHASRLHVLREVLLHQV